MSDVERAAMEREWKEAVSDFLLTPPTDPRCRELFAKAMELDKKCREAGVLPAVR